MSRSQLLALGFDDSKVKRWIEAERLYVVHRGVYAVGRGLTEVRSRWMAGVLACAPASCLGYRSAAHAWGFGPEVAVVEIIRRFNRPAGDSPLELAAAAPRHRLVVHRTRSLPPEDLSMIDGIPVTSVARTFVDLAGLLSERTLRRHFAEASRLDLIDAAAFGSVFERGRGRRGMRRLRRIYLEYVPAESIRTRSALEVRFLRLCRRAGVPKPQVNVVLHGMEVDCLWPASRLVVELDGYDFHRGVFAFERDRRRDLILAQHGYRVIRLTHRAVVYEAEQTAKRLKEAISGHA